MQNRGLGLGIKYTFERVWTHVGATRRYCEGWEIREVKP